jgi:hypothetical protein
MVKGGGEKDFCNLGVGILPPSVFPRIKTLFFTKNQYYCTNSRKL